MFAYWLVSFRDSHFFKPSVNQITIYLRRGKYKSWYAYPLPVAWIWNGTLLQPFRGKTKYITSWTWLSQRHLRRNHLRQIRWWNIPTVLSGGEMRFFIAPRFLALLCSTVQLFPMNRTKVWFQCLAPWSIMVIQKTKFQCYYWTILEEILVHSVYVWVGCCMVN